MTVEDTGFGDLEQSITEDPNDDFSFTGGAFPCVNTKIVKPGSARVPEIRYFVTKYAVATVTIKDALEW